MSTKPKSSRKQIEDLIQRFKGSGGSETQILVEHIESCVEAEETENSGRLTKGALALVDATLAEFIEAAVAMRNSLRGGDTPGVAFEISEAEGDPEVVRGSVTIGAKYVDVAFECCGGPDNQVISVEQKNGIPRVIIWADQESVEPTHVIAFQHAMTAIRPATGVHDYSPE